jgi:hypothetical protein
LNEITVRLRLPTYLYFSTLIAMLTSNLHPS